MTDREKTLIAYTTQWTLKKVSELTTRAARFDPIDTTASAIKHEVQDKSSWHEITIGIVIIAVTGWAAFAI